MIASLTNFSPLATIVDTPTAALQDISVITDGDYSSVYSTTLSGQLSVKFTFPTAQQIDYIAIGGSNIAKKSRLKIEVLNGTGQTGVIVDDEDLNRQESSTLMYRVNLSGVSEIEFVIFGSGQVTISEIAMGTEYEIPRGAQSGYKKGWSVPNLESRSSTGLDGSPISLSYQSRSLSNQLAVPNNKIVDFEKWYNFTLFASSNTFYILEDENKFHSYACFNGIANMSTVHPQTPALVGSSIKFNMYSKSNEALL